MITFVTTACGKKHRGYAAGLAASFREWGWPRLIIIADGPVNGCDPIIIEDNTRGGRKTKILFATYLPLIKGSVFFIDSDCEAVGPYVGAPILLSGQMAGLIRATYFSKPKSHLLCSALLGFHDATEAAAIGREWWRQYLLIDAEGQKILTDEHALYRATKGREIINCGDGTTPLLNLSHFRATTRNGVATSSL